MRFRSKLKSSLCTNFKFKPLQIGKHSHAGRNYQGLITVRHRQKGSKRRFFIIDYKRHFLKNLAICVGIQHNSRGSCLLALLKYSNGVFSYILSPNGLFYGDYVRTAQHDMMYGRGYKLGYAVFLYHLPVNTIFFNLELYEKKGAQYARSAGTHCRIVSEDPEKSLHQILLPTEQTVLVSSYCIVTLGRASNLFHKKIILGKAGVKRLKGFRPTVRGVAMNPVDHPHGGRTKTSSPEYTPWGKIAKFNK